MGPLAAIGIIRSPCLCSGKFDFTKQRPPRSSRSAGNLDMPKRRETMKCFLWGKRRKARKIFWDRGKRERDFTLCNFIIEYVYNCIILLGAIVILLLPDAENTLDNSCLERRKRSAGVRYSLWFQAPTGAAVTKQLEGGTVSVSIVFSHCAFQDPWSCFITFILVSTLLVTIEWCLITLPFSLPRVLLGKKMNYFPFHPVLSGHHPPLSLWV